MKNTAAFLLLAILILSLSSCELVGGIFKAGMGFGIFLVVAIIAVVVFIISRASR